MPEWLSLRRVAVYFGLFSLLVFVGHGFFDFRFLYSHQVVDLQLIYFALVYLLIIAAWVWSLFDIDKGRKFGFYVLIALNIFCNMVAVLYIYAFGCSGGCANYPMWRFWNNIQLIAGVITIVVTVLALTMPPEPAKD